jgi:hypothetical protein
MRAILFKAPFVVNMSENQKNIAQMQMHFRNTVNCTRARNNSISRHAHIRMGIYNEVSIYANRIYLLLFSALSAACRDLHKLDFRAYTALTVANPLGLLIDTLTKVSCEKCFQTISISLH